MSIDALDVVIGLLISVITAISGAWLAWKRMNTEKSENKRTVRRDLIDDLYKEIERLNDDNSKLREDYQSSQIQILELNQRILDLQATVNELNLKVATYEARND